MAGRGKASFSGVVKIWFLRFYHAHDLRCRRSYHFYSQQAVQISDELLDGGWMIVIWDIVHYMKQFFHDSLFGIFNRVVKANNSRHLLSILPKIYHTHRRLKPIFLTNEEIILQSRPISNQHTLDRPEELVECVHFLHMNWCRKKSVKQAFHP